MNPGTQRRNRTFNLSLIRQLLFHLSYSSWYQRKDSNLHHSLIWRLQCIRLPHYHCATLAGVHYFTSLFRVSSSHSLEQRKCTNLLEPMRGIEPLSPRYKWGIIPLYYTGWLRRHRSLVIPPHERLHGGVGLAVLLSTFSGEPTALEHPTRVELVPSDWKSEMPPKTLRTLDGIVESNYSTY